MKNFSRNTHVARKYVFTFLLILLSSTVHARMLVESFGFGGQSWEIKQLKTIEAFNQQPISHGYSFIHFLNPETGHRVNAFVVHNGDHLTVCDPRVDIVLPLLRSLASAHSEQNVTEQVILESEVQKNLISTCEVSFSSAIELKKLFNRAAGYDDMPGLAVNN